MHPNAWKIYSVIICVYHQLHQVNTQCSGSPKTIEVGYKSGFLKYPESGEYDTNQTCEWLLTSTVSGTILYKSFIDIDCSDSYNIYDGPTSSSPAKETGICATVTKPLDRSSGQHLFLKFISDETPGKDNGFTIYFVSSQDRSSCLESGSTTVLIASNTTQAFTSPLFPETYLENHKCSWTISPSTPDATVKLTLYYIDIDFFNNVCYDKLTINYGPFQNETEEVCGNENLSPNKSYTNGGSGNITVTFTSDGTQEESGFVAVFSEMVPDTTVPPTETPTTEPPTTVSTTTELTTTEPSTTQSTATEPSTTESTTTETSTTQSTTTEPSTKQSTTTEPSTIQSTTTEPSTRESTTTEPSTTQSTATEPSTPQSSTTELFTTLSSIPDPSTRQSTTTQPSTTSRTTLESSSTTVSFSTDSTTKEPSVKESTSTDFSTTESSTTSPPTTEPSTTKPLTTESQKPDPPKIGTPKADTVLQFEPFVATFSFMFIIVLIPIIIFVVFLVRRSAKKKHDKSRPDDSHELDDMSSVPSWRVSYTPKLYDSCTYERGHSKRRSEGVMTGNEYSFPQMEVVPYGYHQMSYGPYSPYQ